MLESITVFGINLYDLLNTAAHLGMVVLIALTLNDYKRLCTLPRLAAARLHPEQKTKNLRFWCFLEAVFIFGVVLAVSGPFSNGISMLFLNNTETNYFYNIFCVPLFLFLLGAALKASPLRLNDYVAPLECFSLILYKIACYLQGCCYGKEIPATANCIIPFYNYREEAYQVPVQMIEAVCAAIMLVVILLLRRKKDRRPGLIYPLFILMYCGSRFVSEFWRADQPFKFANGTMTGYHIQCIIGFALGAVYLAVVLVWGKRITAFFETKNEAWLNKKLAAGKSKKKSRAHGKKQPIVHAKKRKKK